MVEIPFILHSADNNQILSYQEKTLIDSLFILKRDRAVATSQTLQAVSGYNSFDFKNESHFIG